MSMPPNKGPERTEYIMNQILEGKADFQFAPVTSVHNGKTCVFRVFRDALKVDGIRINVTAYSQQQIADVTGCMLLTAKIADLAWCQREIHVDPHSIWFDDGGIHMADTSWMKKHSDMIDNDVLGREGLIGTVGKIWINDNYLAVVNKAMNYGWHVLEKNSAKRDVCASLQRYPSGQYVKMIQSRGTFHDEFHEDYSQVCVLLDKFCELDGQKVEVASVLTDPNLAPLGSHQGVLKVLRQPRVPEIKGKLILPPTLIAPDSDVS